MQTLIDTQLFKIFPQSLTEAVKTEQGNLIVEGLLQSTRTENGNNRTYPKKVLAREVDNYKSGPIAENRALGELDHPDSSIINLKNVSHNIKDIWWDGDDVIGKIEILPTPSGNILMELFKNGITVGVSSRGMGSLKPGSDGVQEVQDDFELLCWDFVSTPSTLLRSDLPDSNFMYVSKSISFTLDLNRTNAEFEFSSSEVALDLDLCPYLSCLFSIWVIT